MRNLISPTVRLCIGITALTVSFTLCAHFFGLIYDDTQTKLDARAKLAENLAIQLSYAASIGNTTLVQRTINTVVERSLEVKSIAIRRTDGKFSVEAGGHAKFWKDTADNISTPSNVIVPIQNGNSGWGVVQIAFEPLKISSTIIGIPNSIVRYVGFLVSFGFLTYYFLLRRSLKELDPNKVIPNHVQAAFDTLAEGVLVVDEREQILMVNSSFLQVTDLSIDELIGRKLNEFNWRYWASGDDPNELPWQTAIRKSEPVTDASISMRLNSGAIKNFTVNASSILDNSGRVTGAIVTLDDMTNLERKNEDLTLAVHQLKITETEVTRKNLELKYLANHDSLSGCLNRRALFEQFDAKLGHAKETGKPLSCLMVDLDHFKRVNDTYGHSTGDKVIVGVSQILSASCRDQDLVGRYGGEEFCIVLDGISKDICFEVAERIRNDVFSKSGTWLPDNANVTASIGVSTFEGGNMSALDLVNMADQALYMAKENGRNRVISADGMTPADCEPISAIGNSKEQMTMNDGGLDANCGYLSQQQSNTTGDEISDLVTRSDRGGAFEQADSLTQLPSIHEFSDRMNNSIARAQRNQTSIAVLCLSIDACERITEVYGEAICKKVIIAIADRLTTVLRSNDTVSIISNRNRFVSISRSDKSKFIIEVTDLTELNTVTWIVKRIFDSVSKSLKLDDHEILATCSIGISLYPDDGSDVETLIRGASSAQSRASKSQDNNAFKFYSKLMGEAAKQQLLLESEIRKALDNDEFTLEYQPIIDIISGKVKAAEVLLRCRNESISGIPIAMLISVAEQTGMITEIGETVLIKAIAQMEKWESNGIYLPKISVNLSAIQLTNRSTGERLIQIISSMKLKPQKIQLEITESSTINDMDCAGEILKRLQKLGVQIALDDFGTDQSSLTYLQKLHPDVIKIDRSFISNIHTNQTNLALVAAIVEMATRLGMRTVAEGVESQEEYNCVRELRCDEIQGYYFARPMTREIFEDWLPLFIRDGKRQVQNRTVDYREIA